jgi:hypothetical protein
MQPCSLCIHAYMHVYIYTHTCCLSIVFRLSSMHTYIHTCIHTYISFKRLPSLYTSHTHTHTHIYIYVYKHHTYTDTGLPSQSSIQIVSLKCLLFMYTSVHIHTTQTPYIHRHGPAVSEQHSDCLPQVSFHVPHLQHPCMPWPPVHMHMYVCMYVHAYAYMHMYE